MNTIPRPPERTATPAEHADTAARIERARAEQEASGLIGGFPTIADREQWERGRTGRQPPRTLHALIEQGAVLTGCSCGAGPGAGCLCEPGGVHLSRFARARAEGLLSAAEFASVIADADVFTGSTVVRDVTL